MGFLGQNAVLSVAKVVYFSTWNKEEMSWEIYPNTEGLDVEEQELVAVCRSSALIRILELGLYFAVPEK